MSLETLIKRCKKNDLKAQESLYKQYKDILFFLSLKYCGNIEEAEDNLQEAFMAIFKSIRKYKGKGSFEGWMKRIVIYKAIDRYKKKVVYDIINEDVTAIEKPESEGVIAFSYSLDTLLKLVQELPDKYRMVFSLYELDDYTHLEIANLLNITVGTSKSNLHRAKAILKEKLLVLEKKQAT
ncbi:RNA polymerase sigma factor [Ascidiimonas sp. W6]|uniref:RNA polymerase sigma factor n=1 Tax=Ascidiimonas meishanensis TaxID=3128903 RepID=UPI0030EDD594